MPNVYVRFTNVDKHFANDMQVVKNLSLDIYEGEILTILGPSGSGKTTCLMMLAGFEEVTSGSININGKYVNAIPPHKRDIGLVFQSYALFPHMTVTENLAFPLQVRKMNKSDIQKKVTAMLSMLELESYANAYPSQLSGGQQQRVALGRALIFEPKLVLMDEPLGALDKQLREQMQYEIKRLHSELEFTMVYITHDQSEALRLSDRIAIFDQGEIQQVDVPNTIYEFPANAFSASFIGDNNILNGKLIQAYEDTCAVEISGRYRLQGLPIDLNSNTQRVAVAVRPERILISPGNDCYNILSSTVSDFSYLGDYMRVVVGLPSGEEIVVKTPNDRAKEDFNIGQEIKIGWYPEDCRIFASQ